MAVDRRSPAQKAWDYLTTRSNDAVGGGFEGAANRAQNAPVGSAVKWAFTGANPGSEPNRPRSGRPSFDVAGNSDFRAVDPNSATGRQIQAWNDAVNNMPDGEPDPSGSGPSGYGYAPPPPLVLPRMAMPAPELLAQQAYMAVDTARAPYTAALAALAQSRTQGNQAITAANREASTAGRQIQSDWQRRTAGVEQNIAGIYRQALSGLAQMVADNNQAMMNAGFRPDQTAGVEAYGRLSGLGASAGEAAAVRRQQGADSYRDFGQGLTGITTAGRGALASTYAQVLGSLQAQQSAAEAAARFEQFNRQMALQQEIDKINYDASVQEAVANR